MHETVETTERAHHLAFTLALHRVLAPDPFRAACWSPFSVVSALGLAATAAEGTTRQELLAALVGATDGDLTGCADLLTDATRVTTSRRGEPAVLAVANTLWAGENVSPRPSFVEETGRWPGGVVREAPFAADPQHARQLINSDVAETTRGLIPELVPPGAVDQSTVAALVNALYLRTSWTNRFPEHATESRPFHAVGGDEVVPTMRVTARMGYAAVDGWQVVSIPAAGGVEAVVLVPDGGLAAVEPRLDTDALAALLDAPRPTRVELFLPRLRVSARTSLRAPLERLGVRSMFTDDADLRGLDPNVRTHVSAALHQAVLTVDESGLEGAAATATMVTMAAVVREPSPVVVRADRPFLLVVRHAESRVVYFLARVVRP